LKFEILRSLLFTLLLLATTAILGALAVWQMREGSLDRLLGAPPIELGERIYPDFQPENVVRISLRSGETHAVFVKTPRGWVATAPWEDHMDYRAALAILSLANTTVAVDRVERDKLDPAAAGLAVGNTEINYQDASGETLAYFRLGRRTPWLHLAESGNPQSAPETIPTTYLLPLESGRKSHVYAATGDLSPLFKDGFRRLREHLHLPSQKSAYAPPRESSPWGATTPPLHGASPNRWISPPIPRPSRRCLKAFSNFRPRR
jgi:hypothetical protein